MPLEVGSRLGHYDVTALIGQGGMGEVYQARDTKLDRAEPAIDDRIHIVSNWFEELKRRVPID